MEKTFLVTGASSGIGKAAAKELARNGATVILTCRSLSKGQTVLEEIKRETRNNKVDLMIADLSELRQVRNLAAEVKSKYPRLDALINNAGAWNDKRIVTADGFETTFAVNHLAYFLLTIDLLDLLKSSAPARIVNVSSGLHKIGRINFEDLQGERGYGGLKAYSQSKLANVILSYELARRLRGTGVTANCMHPGGVRTNIYSHMKGLMRINAILNWPLMRTPKKGAETVVWLAISSEVEGITGKYFIDRKERRSSRASYDPIVARKLWEISEQMTISQHLTRVAPEPR